MKFRMKLMRVGLLGLLMTAPAGCVPKVYAAAVPQLVISQFKVTSSGGQFVTLYNQSSTAIDLAQYEFDYINSSNKLTNIVMAGQLAPHSFYMLSDDQLRMCYQMTASSVSLGFATTSGTMQIWQVSADKMTKQLQDGVTWASKATPGAVTLPTQNSTNTVSLLRQPTDSLGSPQLTSPLTGTWLAVVPDTTNACTLNIVNTSTATLSPYSNPANRLGAGQAPPSTVVSLTDATNEAGMSMLPSADIGLDAPQITELLPNPDGTGNDAEDEFVELYNPNSAPFHLVGFTLQTGSTTKRKYTFPDGIILAPHSFTAFYSIDTRLSLSNTSSQAELLDPFGTVLSHTDNYTTAKDGQTWALADGKWLWTAKSTPNAANVIQQAVATSKAAAAGSTPKAAPGAVKGASTTKPATQTAAISAKPEAAPARTHPYILAAVAVLAVGYGVYEYRHDLGNRIHQFRSNRAARRTARA